MSIRLAAIELTNFKNVKHGKIKMPSQLSSIAEREDADIVGIYGQNGSGKTAVIESLMLIKRLLSGRPLPLHTRDYITKNEERASIKLNFCVDLSEICYDVEYTVGFSNSTNMIELEGIKILQLVEGARKTVDSIIMDNNAECVFKPKKRWQGFTATNKSTRIDIEVEKKLCLRENRSVLFSNEIDSIIFNESNIISAVVNMLKGYGKNGLFVIKSEDYIGNDSIEFVLPSKNSITSYYVSLVEPTIMPESEYKCFVNVVNKLNIVMKAIIPGFVIKIHEFGQELLRNSGVGMRFELLSSRDDMLVPIRYESEGIKKMLSMLNLIIAMYNNDSVCVVVDEMDAGIFEFLLGELLSCIEECGKGQLIFTSHNLRPLEMINQEALIFTTTNPNNRYIRIREKTQNLRNSYLRHIMLGGLNETIYEDTNSFEIANALRICSME